MTAPAVQIPGYLAGSWTIDPAHSDISFTVRHMMVSKVRGSFRTFTGTIVTGADPSTSSVSAEIDMSSIDTNNAERDGHIRSGDFFEVEKYPTMTYQSTSVRAADDGFVVEGELALKGITRPIPLSLEFSGAGPDPFGGTRAGFSATAQINRKDFGIDFNLPIDGGGVVVGDKIAISLEIEAVLATPTG